LKFHIFVDYLYVFSVLFFDFQGSQYVLLCGFGVCSGCPDSSPAGLLAGGEQVGKLTFLSELLSFNRGAGQGNRTKI
jgi:hypothetical protein